MYTPIIVAQSGSPTVQTVKTVKNLKNPLTEKQEQELVTRQVLTPNIIHVEKGILPKGESYYATLAETINNQEEPVTGIATNNSGYSQPRQETRQGVVSTNKSGYSQPRGQPELVYATLAETKPKVQNLQNSELIVTPEITGYSVSTKPKKNKKTTIAGQEPEPEPEPDYAELKVEEPLYSNLAEVFGKQNTNVPKQLPPQLPPKQQQSMFKTYLQELQTRTTEKLNKKSFMLPTRRKNLIQRESEISAALNRLTQNNAKSFQSQLNKSGKQKQQKYIKTILTKLAKEIAERPVNTTNKKNIISVDNS